MSTVPFPGSISEIFFTIIRLKTRIITAYVYYFPRITFPELEKEIYVHEYYLKNLCDEVTYPNWPIGDPLKLLRVSTGYFSKYRAHFIPYYYRIASKDGARNYGKIPR